MNLLRAAGLVESAPADLRTTSREAFTRMVAEGVDFLRAGGVVSLAEWRELDEAEKDAMVEAGNVVACERAAAYGIAAQSPAAAAKVASGADGGESMRTMSLESVLSRVAAKVPAEPSVGVDA